MDTATVNETTRLQVVIGGAVQGVGFRPFVYRLAKELGLTGWVSNSPQGVRIEVEGTKAKVQEFLLRCEREKPPNAIIQSLESVFLDPAGYDCFEIAQSETAGPIKALVLPDIATCKDCLSEIFDPQNRRYLYPFTNCTNCGPRFTIIEALPYDRPNTSMRHFCLCPACRREYHDPADRRFHAQPNACEQCGPQLELWDADGASLAKGRDALECTTEAIRDGQIVAVKGLGGFHLIADARNEQIVQLLRQRKHREEKPLAIMLDCLESVRRYCCVSEREGRLLQSSAAPIVLLKRKVDSHYKIASSVAPANPYLGVMLPYTPLHHILMRQLNIPVIATSGNLSDEPICTDEYEAIDRLAGIADVFLVHDRPIVRHVDDSVVRMMSEREMIVRRGRGYSPLPIRLKSELPSVLAVGAHLKNSVAVSTGRDVFISQHIGDLESIQAYTAFKKVIEDFQRLYEPSIVSVACDLHPDFLSTQYAARSGFDVIAVQHHVAHVLSCMADNELDGMVLGVSWDGTGLGTDGTIWGGEFLLVGDCPWRRVGHLRTFSLPGGEYAIRRPSRSACGVLYEIYGEKFSQAGQIPAIEAFSRNELQTISRMLKKQINTFVTSSAGRLFDAVAAIAGIRQINRYEGQAAMELEFAIDTTVTDEAYSIFVVKASGQTTQQLLLIDWEPMIREIIEDKLNNIPVSIISAKFHNALAEAIVLVAAEVGAENVLLTGGCFQNKYLTERAIDRLKRAGFHPYWHQRIPPNDGGIAVGQVLAVAQEKRMSAFVH